MAKKALLALIVGIIITGSICVLAVTKVLNRPVAKIMPQVDPVQVKPVVTPEKLLETGKQKIMENNISGKIIKTDGGSLSVGTAAGDRQFNLTEGSRVYVINTKITSKKPTDLRAGMKVYVQFDSITNNALTITIL